MPGCFILLCTMDSSPNSVPPAQEVGIFTSSPHPPQGPSEGGLTSSPPLQHLQGGTSPPPLPQGYIMIQASPSLFWVGGLHILPPPSATRGRGSDLLLPPSRGGPQGLPSPAHSSLLSTGSSLRWVFPSLGPPFTGSFFPLLRRPCGASSLCWVFPSIDLSFTGSSLQWIFP